MKRRSLIALVFLLPFCSQAQDTPQTNETTSQTQKAFYISGRLGSYKKHRSKPEVKAEDASQEAKDTTSQTEDASQEAKDTTSQTEDAPQEAKDTTSQTEDTSQQDQETTSQTQKAFYISGLLGFSNMDEEKFSFDTGVSFGVRIGFLFKDHFSAGIHVQRYSSPSQVEIPSLGLLKDLTFTFTNWMVEFNYYINKIGEDGFWFGGLLGATQVKLEHPLLPSEDNNETSFGLSCGYQFMVTPNFSIAPQITYIRIDSGEFHESLTQFSGLINFTFWN